MATNPLRGGSANALCKCYYYKRMKKCIFNTIFLLCFAFVFQQKTNAATLCVISGPSCDSTYTTIQTAIDNSSDNDTIYISSGTYNEDVIVDKALGFQTEDNETVSVRSFDLRNSANIVGNGSFAVDTVYVKSGASYSIGGGIGDAISFVKTGGIVEVEGKSAEERCLNNHWIGGITINKNMTLQSSSLVNGEGVCLTDASNAAITVTSGTVVIKNFLLFDSAIGLKVDGGTVTVLGGAILENTEGIVTATGTSVEAKRIYWGDSTGPYNVLNNPKGRANSVGNEVRFCPYYENMDKTNLNDDLCRNISFRKDTKCRWKKPPETTWVFPKPQIYNSVSGIYLTWVQYSADKVDILIDDGTGNFPWKIGKTANDGHEFLPNVAGWQNIKIKPYNHCRTGDTSVSISANQYPNGWYQ